MIDTNKTNQSVNIIGISRPNRGTNTYVSKQTEHSTTHKTRANQTNEGTYQRKNEGLSANEIGRNQQQNATILICTRSKIRTDLG